MKTETVVIGGVVALVIALVLLEANSKGAAPAKAKTTDQNGTWTPGIFKGSIRVGQRLIVALKNPGASRAYGVDVSDPSVVELTSSQVSGPDQAIFTGKAVGTATVKIDLFDSSEMIVKGPIFLNGIAQTMILTLDVTL